MLHKRLRDWEKEPIAGSRARLVVADRIVTAARDVLAERGWGWLDLRGHLHLSGPGVLVDTAVPPVSKPRPPADPFAGRVALEIACGLLLEPGRPASVRHLARELGRSPSSVSAALRGLREARLVSSTGEPLIPELFWEVVSAWKPAKIEVARLSIISDPRIANALHTGWGNPLPPSGWALSDAMAAAADGAPVGLGDNYPPDFHVPDAAIARRAETMLGPAR